MLSLRNANSIKRRSNSQALLLESKAFGQIQNAQKPSRNGKVTPRKAIGTYKSFQAFATSIDALLEAILISRNLLPPYSKEARMDAKVGTLAKSRESYSKKPFQNCWKHSRKHPYFATIIPSYLFIQRPMLQTQHLEVSFLSYRRIQANSILLLSFQSNLKELRFTTLLLTKNLQLQSNALSIGAITQKVVDTLLKCGLITRIYKAS